MHPIVKSNEFINLVEAFQTPVYNLCYLLLGDGTAAEQVAQQCFTRAYTQFNEHYSICNTQNWLLRIAYRQCISWHNRSNLQINRVSIGDSRTLTVKGAAVQALLTRLELVDRAVISLHYSYRLELSDVAWVIGADIETVKNRLRQAQKTLATQYCQGVIHWSES
jgi:RNA polymerase sigma-70 factor (ECF subfamily)